MDTKRSYIDQQALRAEAKKHTGGLIDRVSGNLFFRKIYHFTGGLTMAGGLIFLDRRWFIVCFISYFLAFFAFTRRISGAIIGVLLLLVLSNSVFVTLGATIIWNIGDGLSALFGERLGKRKWFWNKRKTVVGSIAFLVGSFVAMFLFLFIWTGITLSPAILMALIPSLAATIVESAPIAWNEDRKPDDNLTVILVTGSVLYVLSTWFGFPISFQMEY